MRQRRRAPAPVPSSPGRHRSRPAARWLVPLLLVLCTQAASFSLPVPASLAAAAVKMPFAAGTEWYISQGYNTSPAEGWSHYNCDPRTGQDQISKTERCDDGWQYKYSVDLRQVDGTETGETVLSPVDGTIRWLDPANGGLSIDLGNGYAAALFHFDLGRGLADGQPQTRLVTQPGDGRDIPFGVEALVPGGPLREGDAVASLPGAEGVRGHPRPLDDCPGVIYWLGSEMVEHGADCPPSPGFTIG